MKYFCFYLKQKSYKDKNSCSKRNSVLLIGCHVTPVVNICCFLTHQCYLPQALPHHWSPCDIWRVLQIWNSISLPSDVFTLELPPAFQGLVGPGSLTSMLAGLHAMVQNIVPGQLFDIKQQSTNLVFKRICI